MSITPEHESDTEHYSRLFRRWPNRPTPNTPAYDKYISGLQDLVNTMRDDGTRVCEGKPEVPIAAGYTYFGQFIDHDLTRDKTRFEEVWNLVPDEITNWQTPQLDLSHLYGNQLADPRTDTIFDGPRFKIGDKVESIIFPVLGGRSFDVGFDEKTKTLLVGDSRAPENVILRQVTAVFARLHNLAVDHGKSFEQARQQTVWQFQRLIVEDYLPHVLDPAVYESVFIEHQSMIRWRHFSIPFEFAAAAFRFGHSMVRNSYFLSDQFPDRKLSDLFDPGLQKQPLQSEWEIDWGKFFQNASPSGTPPITARPIDTRIAPALFEVPTNIFRLFNAAPSRAFVHNNTAILPLASLIRGGGLALASGQYIASRFGEPALTEDELVNDCTGKITPQGEVLQTYDMTEETPLFYYILKESEVRNNGNQLGPTGSHIVAETIYAALKADSTSYLNDPAGAAYPVWDFPSGKGAIQSLIDLFKHANEF
jgi:hypothetical protein